MCEWACKGVRGGGLHASGRRWDSVVSPVSPVGDAGLTGVSDVLGVGLPDDGPRGSRMPRGFQSRCVSQAHVTTR